MILNQLRKDKSINIVKELWLAEDCKLKVNFPEGDYLKGYILKKNQVNFGHDK